jgi:hypothetical protein
MIAEVNLPAHPPSTGGSVSVTVVGSLNEDVLVAVGRLPGRGGTVIGRSATRTLLPQVPAATPVG